MQLQLQKIRFGEPCILGFCRSFGQRLPAGAGEAKGERVEFIKPIMFSAGLGQMDDRHTSKKSAEPGMLVVKVLLGKR